MTNSTIVFSNPGEIDPRLITTLGVNVKEGVSPIGFFGTGLKYAIAVALRLGARIEIRSGLRQFQFELQPETIRGKEFQLIAMTEVDYSDVLAPKRHRQVLGFTTELGKAWEPWMAYRELACNAKDEGGRTDEFHGEEDLPEPEPGGTYVLVSGPAFSEAHAKRGEFLLESPPLFVVEGVEVHQGPSQWAFYRGIRVAELAKPSLYKYNITDTLRLTEDRTCGLWEIEYTLAGRLVQCQNEVFLQKCLMAKEEFYESGLNFRSTWRDPSQQFVDVTHGLVRSKAARVNSSAVVVASKHSQERFLPEPTELTAVEARMLERATAFAKALHFELSQAPIVVDSLGENVLGMAHEGRVYLSRRAFMSGTKQVAATLIEEIIHHELGHDDCSRGMQNFLLEKLVSLGEELQGEPL